MADAILTNDSYKAWANVRTNNMKIDGEVMEQASAAAVTTTLSAANVATNKVVTCTTAGGAVSLQMPTAALLVAAFPTANIGSAVKCRVVAWGHASNAITVTTNTGVTLLGAGECLIGARSSRDLVFIFTNVSSGTEAVSVY